MLPPLLIAALLIAAFVKLFAWHPAFLEPSWNAVYRIQNGVWQALPELPGDPEKLQVSAGGAVWALYWHYGVGGELARFDGVAWRRFTAKEFGVRSVLASDFVLDGEDVWMPTDEGVLHWDGAYWKCYREAMVEPNESSIAAAHGQVWVIDGQGTLRHFDGRQWTQRKVEWPGTTRGDDEDDSPELASTDDGSLWLARNGIWRWDGAQWTPAKSGTKEFEEASLMGATGKSIWLAYGNLLVSLAPDGTLRRFARAQMGLGNERIDSVAENGGRIEVATSRGILEFDGSAWRRLPAPGNGVEAVVAIRAGAGGELLAIGNTPHPVARRWQVPIRMIPLVLMLGVVAMIVWMVRIYKRRKLDDHQRMQQAVEHATGAIPEELARDERLLAKQSSWWSATMTVGVVIGAGVLYQMSRIFWPGVPSWMFLAIAFALHTAVTVGQSLIRKTPKPWDPIEPGGASFDWGPTRQALPASLAVFLLMNLGAFPKWLGDPVVWLLNGVFALMWYKVLEHRFMLWALRRGDFDGALRVIRLFRFYNPESGKALALRGVILLLAGRYEEAEETLRRAVARLRSRTAQAQALESLGDALLERGRYDEAWRSYEAAMRAAPSFRRPYRGMAELVLRQGRDPGRALECIEKIEGKGTRDDYCSLKAWALAELGRGSEVEAAVAEAIRKTNLKSRPDVATTYRRLGLAMQAMDRQAEAEEYLKKAVDAGPHGRWPALAQAALDRKSVWSA